MKRMLSLVLIVACALPAGAASVRAARPAAKRPARKSAPKAPKAEAKSAPAAAAAPAADSLDDIALFGLGAALVAQDDGLVVASVRPGSRAEQAGLKSGDQLLRVDGDSSSRAKVAGALRAWTPGTRLALVVRRGLEILPLETAPIPPARDYARGDRDLSEHEKALAAERSAQAVSDGRAVVSAVGPLVVPVRAEQGLWLRFTKGLPAGLKKGDEVVAEAATGLTVDATLDFLAVPPGSKMRARVLDAVDDGVTRTVRLAFYALDLSGGGTYTTLGSATAVSGDQRMARVAAGGTLVAAAPLPDAKRRAPEPVLDADARLRVRLLDPLVVDEPPSYWRVGPGLWVRTVEDSGKRLFEITHAIAGRSAEAAGLKIGDRLDAIGGRSTDKMDFAEAIDRLYGAPGTEVEVSVLRGKSQAIKLKRGLRWAGAKSAALPPPYNAQ
ncbi:MAG: PDZ domain-containing protein [Elusimicrobia bacterium]|nr:PDZ domain-containing protein [Elusimicrobiota bacterium]